MAETAGSPPESPQGCENPLDELKRDENIQLLLGKQEAARRGITDAVRQELENLSNTCSTPEKHEESLRTTLEALLHKKAQEDFASEVLSRAFHFADGVETRASDDFSTLVSKEIWDQKALRFRSPEQWAAFYKKTLKKFFDALVEKAQKSADDNKITFADVNSALESLDDFHSFYRGRPDAAFATEGILAGSSETIQQKQGALTSLISEMRGQRQKFDALPSNVKVEIEGIEAKISSTHSLDALKAFDTQLQALRTEHNLVPITPDAEAKKVKEEATPIIIMLLDASVGLNAEDKTAVEGLKKKLDDASDADAVTPLRKELDAMAEKYRKPFRDAIAELIKILKPELKAPDGAQAAPSTPPESTPSPKAPEAPSPSPESPERKEAREQLEEIEKKFRDEKNLKKLAAMKGELDELKKSYVTAKKEVGSLEKIIYKFLLGTGLLAWVRSLFGEEAYRGALDVIAGLANDGAIDDEDALLSHGIVKNQNGLFEVSEVMLPSNDAFLKDRFEISEEGLRKKLLKTKLKDFLEDKVNFENYDTAREAYKDQIGVLKKVIKENPAGKDRGQTLDTFLKKAGIRSTLIEELRKLHTPNPNSGQGTAVAGADERSRETS